MKLIRHFLRVPVQINGKLHKWKKGVPQGSLLSPLLSNILLNELGQLHLCYVRYADDFSIYVKSKASAKRVGNNIYKSLRDALRLPINREKGMVCRSKSFEMLGFGFVPTYRKNEKGKYQAVVAKTKWQSFKRSLKYLTKKTPPMGFDERISKLNLPIRGWANYFKPASISGKLKKLDEWL